MSKNQQSKSETRISIPSTYQEVEDIQELAGGKRNVANYLRNLILKDASERGIKLNENSFIARPGGYDVVGESRKGGKENGSLMLVSTPVVGL